MRSVHDWLAINEPEPGNRGDDMFRALTLGIVYALVVLISNLFSQMVGAPAPVWAADGIAVGILLLSPASARFVMLVAVLMANLCIAIIGGIGFILAIIGSAANVLQVAIAVIAIERLAWKKAPALTLRSLLVFYLFVVIFSTGLASGIQTQAAHLMIGRPFLRDWGAGFISDALGTALFVPLVLAWGIGHHDIQRRVASAIRLRPWRLFEGVMAFCATAFFSWFVFSADLQNAFMIRPIVYLIIPALLWIALRFGLRSVTASLILTAGISIYFTAQGLGQFANAVSQTQGLLELQVFLLILSLTILLTAALFNAQRASADELHRTHRRNDAVMRASGNVFFEIDVETRHINWSGDTEAVLGWHSNEINTIDKWNEKVHPDDVERLIGIRKKLTGGDLPNVTLEYRIFKPDGNLIQLGIGAYGTTFFDPLRRQSQSVIIGIAKDITQTTALAERNRELDRNLRQAQKMESIGQLAGGIAHDFNNILAAILGYGEMAKARLSFNKPFDVDVDRPKLVRYIDTILQAADRGKLLVAQVLTFSRRAPEQQAAIELTPLVSEVVQLLRGSFSTQIMLDIETRDSVVLGDPTALHQLIMNVCTNGLQAIAELEKSTNAKTGMLSILLTDADFADDAMLTKASQPLQAGRYAVLRIADDGIGMTEEVRKRMFDPFFTTKSVGSGTGLGLSLAMSIAHAHGGAICCDSTVGNGTTFSIYLPIGTAPFDAHGSVTRMALPGHGQTIMLVDDEAPLRQLGGEILMELGYRPILFASSEEAWAQFEIAPNQYDAILTDEVMPGMTGTQLAGRIHALRRDIPIIVITAYGGAGFQLRAEEVGVAKILRKPYRRDDLAEALGQVFATKY